VLDGEHVCASAEQVSMEGVFNVEVKNREGNCLGEVLLVLGSFGLLLSAETE